MSTLIPISPDRRTAVDVDVVFVHGLEGHHHSTWALNEDGASWAEWLAIDLPNAAVWSFDYPASISRWTGHAMPLLARASDLASHLVAKGIGIGDRPVVFITHSLGGLLVKQVLRNVHDQIAAGMRVPETFSRPIGIVFFGTPHAGAPLASLINAWSVLSRATVTARELTDEDQRLSELNTWLRNQLTELDVRVLVFQESKPTPPFGVVVDAHSSDPGFPGVYPISLDCDHITLCKFRDRDEMPFERVKQFIRQIVTSLLPSTHAAIADLGVECAFSVATVYPAVKHSRQFDAPGDRTARYVITRRPRLKVSVTMPYMDRFSSGGPIEANRSIYGQFRWAFPAFDFKVLNNSDQTVMLTDVDLTVLHSRPSSRTLLLFSESGRAPGACHIGNEGAPVYSAEAAINLFGVDEEITYDPPFLYGAKIGDIISYADPVLADPESDVMRADVESRPALKSSLEKYQFANAAGVLNWTTAEGNKGSVRFKIGVSFRGLLWGVPTPPFPRYHVMLQACSDSYHESVSIAHTIEPGKTDRFHLLVAAPCWSQHEIEVSIDTLGAGTLELGKVGLEVFVPRSGAGVLRRFEGSLPSD
jgi:Alpha/beta hydrolase family